MHDQLLSLIAQNVTLSENDTNLCKQYFMPVFFQKNQLAEPEGEIPKNLYFVVSGFLRLFHYDENGNEVTTNINCPPGFIVSYTHFINQTKSHENLECITDCELLSITKDHLDLLTQQSATFKDFSIWVFQQALAYKESRSKELATRTAKQRYHKLINHDPHILQNVPLQHIASFLGMNPKSLSRIRKEIIK